MMSKWDLTFNKHKLQGVEGKNEEDAIYVATGLTKEDFNSLPNAKVGKHVKVAKKAKAKK